MTSPLLALPLDCALLVCRQLAMRDLLALECCSRAHWQLLQVRGAECGWGAAAAPAATATRRSLAHSHTTQDDAVWQQLARSKWGERVPQLAAWVEPGGWRAFAVQRLASASPAAPSPLDLIQELYTDPWQHLVVCLSCSRTTGGPAVREAIAALLARWPTPSALLGAPQAHLLEALHAVGLQAIRLAALTAMSRDFLATAWEDPTAFKGCGRFCADSWRIFCRGHRSLAGVEDANLQRYLRWLVKGEVGEKRQRHKGGQRAKRGADERAAEPGTLRSGRRRAGVAAGAAAAAETAPTPERRQTRQSARGAAVG